MLSVRNLRKVYTSKKAEEVVALNNVSIEFPETGFVFLLGKSGSGKSTLLNAIGGLDKFDGGEIIIKGKSSKDFSQADFDSYRNTFIGFIFQEYNILENFTVAKNLALALELQGKKADKAEVMRLLEQVEMQAYANRKPNELSGGQKQRVAIARALIKNPEIIMADEPTGALDSNTGKQVMDTLKELSKTKLIIVVSHDREFAEYYGDRIIELKDGKILHDTTRKEIPAEETKSGIKIIDDDIVYIKKGQEISSSELKAIGEIIVSKSKDSEAFISFNKEANAKVKEGAKINDDGNKEKFLNTEPEDVKTKQYNPNSLKLIKSHLGFKDSFKMGASSLKNKVGKLVFTILLSFFAFTCFGIIDALSQWNRASSVYDAMKINNVKTIVMTKQKKVSSGGISYADSKYISETDVENFKKEYKDYTFVPVVGDNWGRSDVSVQLSGTNFDSFSTNNDYKKFAIGGYVTVTTEDLAGLGFTLDGNLPSSDNEIAISKFMLKNLISLTAEKTNKINNSSDLIGKTIRVNNNEYTVVGIVDDGTTFEKYENMTEDAIKNDRTIDNVLKYSPVSFGYVSKNRFNKLKSSSSGDYLYSKTSESSGYGSNSISKNSLVSLQDMYELECTNYSSGYTYYYNDLKKIAIINDTIYTAEYTYSGIYSSNVTKKQKIYSNYNGSESGESISVSVMLGELGLSGTSVTSDSSQKETWATSNGFVKETRYTEEIFLMKHFQFFGDVDLLNATAENGTRFKDLASTQAIVSKDMFYEGLDDAIKSGKQGTLKYFIYDNYPSDSSAKLLKTLDCIAITDFSYSRDNLYIYNVVCSSEENLKDLSSYYGSYSCMLTSLKGTSTDEALVKTCELYNSDNVKFAIQNDTTKMLDTLEEIISMAAGIFVWIAVAFAVFAALMLMNFISTSINYKKREIGVLRALGARGSDVFGIFLNESMIIALINFGLSAVATIVGCKIINSALISSLGYSISLLNVGIRQIILILAVSCGSAILASLLPTSKISRKKPIDAINNR